MLFKEDLGALGQGDFYNYAAPTLIEQLENIVQVEAGYLHSVALDSFGHVYVWGNNAHSQLGLHSAALHTPKRLRLSNIKKISAARHYTVALSHSGVVLAWGENHYQQLGVEHHILQEPTEILTGVSDIEAGEGGICVVHNKTLGVQGFSRYHSLTEFALPNTATSLSAGDECASVLLSNGLVLSLGGLFGAPHSYFFTRKPTVLTEAAELHFPGRVLSLHGKYSYFAALLA